MPNSPRSVEWTLTTHSERQNKRFIRLGASGSPTVPAPCVHGRVSSHGPSTRTWIRPVSVQRGHAPPPPAGPWRSPLLSAGGSAGRLARSQDPGLVEGGTSGGGRHGQRVGNDDAVDFDEPLARGRKRMRAAEEEGEARGLTTQTPPPRHGLHVLGAGARRVGVELAGARRGRPLRSLLQYPWVRGVGRPGRRLLPLGKVEVQRPPPPRLGWCAPATALHD